VGLITETFRLQAGSLRSDNPTHSVAARGKFAADLVDGHASGKGRYGVFGDLCFGHESPWQRMFDSRTRYGVRCYVLFWGVDTVYNTFKHFAEYRLTEKLLDGVGDAARRDALRAELRHMPPVKAPEGVEQIWPYYTAKLLEPMLFETGIAKRISIGEGELILFDIYEMMTFTEDVLENSPERIVESKAALGWITRAKAAEN
jgi:aminoglycoside N3'-acetyltransferase